MVGVVRVGAVDVGGWAAKRIRRRVGRFGVDLWRYVLFRHVLVAGVRPDSLGGLPRDPRILPRILCGGRCGVLSGGVCRITCSSLEVDGKGRVVFGDAVLDIYRVRPLLDNGE